MDELTFWSKIAETLASLAWPAVAVTVLVVYRDHFVDFLERIVEVVLPGGTKLTLKDRLAKGDVEVEIVKAEVVADDQPPLQPEHSPTETEVREEAHATDETDATVVKPDTEHPSLRGLKGLDHEHFLELVRTYPAAGVLETWNSIEALLLAIRETVPDAPRRWNLRAVMRQLVSWNLMTENAFELYETMRGVRNIAAHSGAQVSASDAIRFRRQAVALRTLLLRVLDKLRENPRTRG